jgi:tetratricopeptide (TPR) repeat protein
LATLNGGPVPAASDVFSLGVIAFELLTGRRPFQDHAGEFDQTVDRMVADRQRKAPSVRSLNPQVSGGLLSIVARCLAPELQNRYASAAQLAEDLRCYQRDLPLRYAPEPSVRERGRKWLRRNARGVRWAVAASLVALLVSLSAMYMLRHQRLADLEAATAFSEFEADAQTALLNLHSPGSEPELHSLGRAAAERAVERLGLLEGDAGADADFSRLVPAQQSSVRRQGVELLYSLASLASLPVEATPESAKEKQRTDAIRYNDAALSLLPANEISKALLEQRMTLLKAVGDELGASKVGEQARQAAPGEQDKFFAAAGLLEKRDFAEAVRAWEQLSNENRQDPQRWLLLGNAYAGAGRLANAEACYTALIALQPKAMSGYLYRGLCRSEQGNFPAAENDYTEALLLNPSVAATRINRALTYYALRNFAAAERDTTAAIEAGLADPRAYFVRALIRDAVGKREEAKADRQRGFAIQPVDDKGWVARGIAVLRDDPPRAAREFEQGIRAFSKSKPLLQNLVHVYGDRLSRPDEALVYADKLVDLSPNDSSALASRAVMLARKGDVEAALRDGERAAASRPSALTSMQLACVYALVSRTKPAEASSAIRHFQRALAGDPKLARRAATDADLAAIQSNTEFQSILAAAARLTESTPGSPQQPSKPSPKRAAQDDAKQQRS